MSKNSVEEIYKSSLKFLTPLDLESTYKIIIQEAVRLLGGSHGTIYISEHNELKRVFSSSPKLVPITPRKRGYTYQVYKSKKLRVLSLKEIKKIHPEIESLGMKHDLIVPLVNKGKPYGAMSILTKKTRITKNDEAVLNLFAPLATMAIRKAQLYSELKNALQTRDLFISMASHELRTPVTTLYIYLQMLKKKSEKGQKFNDEWIETLLFEMSRLISLINELLQVNQIKTGDLRYDFEEINLINVTNKALSSFKANHKTTKIIFKNVTKNPEIKLVGDFNKLVQTIINLLDNAAKHNVNNNLINLNINTEKNYAQIVVEDNGSGIKEADLPHVFEEFYKGKGHTKSGMGLGLFLIKKIIDRHKGRIEIESIYKKGTKVTVFLPLVKL